MGLFDGKDVTPTTAPTATADATKPKVAKPNVADATPTPATELTKGQIHNKAIRDAMEKICAYCADTKNNVPTDVLDACKIIRPSFFGLGGGGGFQKAEFRAWQTKLMQILGVKTFEEIKVGATFDEMKVFQTLHAGRKEMKQITNDLIRKTGEKSAVWVSFDAGKGIYTVEGIGDQPKNWTGYVPQGND